MSMLQPRDLIAFRPCMATTQLLAVDLPLVNSCTKLAYPRQQPMLFASRMSRRLLIGQDMLGQEASGQTAER